MVEESVVVKESGQVPQEILASFDTDLRLSDLWHAPLTIRMCL